MSADIGRPSSTDVAHEAEDTRAHLASTLNQLRANLRPENVVDEVMSNARAGAASVADGLAGVARANPLPSLLVAAGAFVVMGFMSRGGLNRSGRAAETKALPRAGTLRNAGTFNLDPDGPRDRDRFASDRSGSFESDGAGLKSKVAAGVDSLKRRAAETYDSASSRAGDAAQSLSHYVPSDRRNVKSKLSNLLDDQPLILGAIGLAVGAAIGAALPITETEDNLMGGPSHQLRQAASDVAKHEVDGLRAIAGEAVDNIKKSVTDHGLSTDNLSDLAKDVKNEARSAVDKVGTAHEA